MREAERRDVRRNLLGKVVPRVHATTPRREVQLIDPHWCVAINGGMALVHPLGVSPLVLPRRRHDAGITRRGLGLASHWIGLAKRPPFLADNLVLVAVARTGGWTDNRPDTRRSAGLNHRHRLRPPFVPIAHNGNRRSVGRPDSELHCAHSAWARTEHLRAKHFPQSTMVALTKQMEIKLANGGRRRPC
jgi:hypothetical protein